MLKLLPAYGHVTSMEEALQTPRVLRLLWLEILVNDGLDLSPWWHHAAVRQAYHKACQWYTTYGCLIDSLLVRTPLPTDSSPVDSREYRTFAEALRFVADHD